MARGVAPPSIVACCTPAAYDVASDAQPDRVPQVAFRSALWNGSRTMDSPPPPTHDDRPRFASLLGMARSLRKPWQGEPALDVNAARLRVMRFQGHFARWHTHAEDECYVVLEGELIVEIEGASSVRLGVGDAYVVRAGVVHRPFATPIANVLLVT
jgi:mannose-6-phosphate isomerase-like protein (cupin superfamily)